MADLRGGGFLLAKVHRLSGRIFSRVLKRRQLHEINPAQGRILFVLWQRDTMPMHELAKQTSLGKSTLTAMLDRLEGEGYVERVADPEDRRTVLVRRTMKDEAFRRAFLEVSEEMTGLWYRGFSDTERDQFEGFLARILVNLEAADKEEA